MEVLVINALILHKLGANPKSQVFDEAFKMKFCEILSTENYSPLPPSGTIFND